MTFEPEELQEYERRLRQTYRRDADRELIAGKLDSYRKVLEERILEEEAREPESVRAEERATINLNLILSLVVTLVFTLLAYLYSEEILEISRKVKAMVTSNLGWFFVLLSTGALIYLGWLAFSRYGDVVLGDPEQQPEFSNLAWYSSYSPRAWGSASSSGAAPNRSFTTLPTLWVRARPPQQLVRPWRSPCSTGDSTAGGSTLCAPSRSPSMGSAIARATSYPRP